MCGRPTTRFASTTSATRTSRRTTPKRSSTRSCLHDGPSTYPGTTPNTSPTGAATETSPSNRCSVADRCPNASGGAATRASELACWCWSIDGRRRPSKGIHRLLNRRQSSTVRHLDSAPGISQSTTIIIRIIIIIIVVVIVIIFITLSLLSYNSVPSIFTWRSLDWRLTRIGGDTRRDAHHLYQIHINHLRWRPGEVAVLTLLRVVLTLRLM